MSMRPRARKEAYREQLVHLDSLQRMQTIYQADLAKYGYVTDESRELVREIDRRAARLYKSGPDTLPGVREMDQRARAIYRPTPNSPEMRRYHDIFKKLKADK